MARMIVFDMDGVLVDVSQSYREAIRETVRQYTGTLIDKELIQTYKNEGGWNNDWALSQRIILDVSGKDVPYIEVVEQFQQIFFGGPEREGLIMRERWIPSNGLMQRLKDQYRIAIFTGRLRAEAAVTLRRFVPELPWDMIVGDDDVTTPKPAPDGLLKIAGTYPADELVYVGDTVDDADAAAAACVPFIGIAHRAAPRHEELTALLKQRGALAVIDNINELESVL